jgi:hypothetical protein
MRLLIACFFILHGLAHLVGFLEPSKEPSLITRELHAGATAMRAFGVMWLLAATAFVVAAVSFAMYRPWALPVTGGTALFSLVLSVLAWPQARIGVYIDAVILAGLGLAAAL